jgi:hypothetical protein
MMIEERGEWRPGCQAYFPSFVDCAVSKTPGVGPEVISHWHPSRSGIEAVDGNLGRGYFLEAISFCRQIGAPYFLVCVLKEMRHSEFGPVESAFVRELASKATAGGNSPGMVAQEASSLVHLHGCDLEFVRGLEWMARDYILSANQHRQPDAVYAAIMEWLRAPDTWIAEVVALAIAGAAMKGALN